jgi:hypothetical protein
MKKAEWVSEREAYSYKTYLRTPDFSITITRSTYRGPFVADMWVHGECHSYNNYKTLKLAKSASLVYLRNQLLAIADERQAHVKDLRAIAKDMLRYCNDNT